MSLHAVVSAFVDRFGHQPSIVTRAPGRVNLMGEHTDYNEGFVLPAAINRYVWVAAEIADSPEFYSLEIDAGDWLKYPRGLQTVVEMATGTPIALHAVVASNVPLGTGVSSSAALELALLTAMNSLYDLNLSPMDLARLGQRCENEVIGLRSGLMDQMASAMGMAHHAIFFDTRTCELRYTRIPEDLALVVCDTQKPRELAASKYNERRSECEAAAAALGVRSLRDATIGLLSSTAALDPVLRRRAHHVITENERTQQTFMAMSMDLEHVGDLFRESHESLRDDYEVSCAELDAMAEACWSAPGCMGARMTGAGFGGACVALVERAFLDSFTSRVGKAYLTATGTEGSFLVCHASDGAEVIA